GRILPLRDFWRKHARNEKSFAAAMPEPIRKRGRPRIFPNRPPLTSTERSRRWRHRHSQQKHDFFPGLKSFSELAEAAGLIPGPSQNGTETVPHRDTPPFDPTVLVAGCVFF